MPTRKINFNELNPSYSSLCQYHLTQLGTLSKYSYNCNYFIDNDSLLIPRYSYFLEAILNGDLAEFEIYLRNGADLSVKSLDGKDIFQLCNPSEKNTDGKINFEIAGKKFEIFQILARHVAIIKSHTKFQIEHSINKNPQYHDFLLYPVTPSLEESFNQSKLEFLRLALENKIAISPTDIMASNIEPIELKEWQQSILLSRHSPYYEYLATYKKACDSEIEIRCRLERGTQLLAKKTAHISFSNSEIFDAIIYGNISDAAYLMSVLENSDGYLEKTKIHGEFSKIINTYFKNLNAYEIFYGNAKISDLDVAKYYPPSNRQNIFNIMLFLKDYASIKNTLPFMPRLNMAEKDGKNVFEKLIYGIENFKPHDDLKFSTISYLIYFGAIYNFEKSAQESEKLKAVIIEFASTEPSKQSYITEFLKILDSFTQKLKTNFLSPVKSNPPKEVINEIDKFLDFYLNHKSQSTLLTLPFIADTNLIKNHYREHLLLLKSGRLDLEVSQILNFVGFLRYLFDFKVIEYFRHHEKDQNLKEKILYKINQLIDCLAENCDIFQDREHYDLKLKEDIAKKAALELIESEDKKKNVKMKGNGSDKSKIKNEKLKIPPSAPLLSPSIPEMPDIKKIPKKIDDAATQTDIDQINSSTQTICLEKSDLSTQTTSEIKKFTVVNLYFYQELISSIIPQSNIEEFEKKLSYPDNQALLFCVDGQNFYPLNYALVYSNLNFLKKIYSYHENLDQANSPISADKIFQSHDAWIKNSLMYLAYNPHQTDEEKIAKLNFLFSKVSSEQILLLINQKSKDEYSLIDITLFQKNDALSLFLIQGNYVNLDLNNDKNSILFKIFNSQNHEFIHHLERYSLINYKNLDQKIIDFLAQENQKIITSYQELAIDQLMIAKNIAFIDYLKNKALPKISPAKPSSQFLSRRSRS